MKIREKIDRIENEVNSALEDTKEVLKNLELLDNDIDSIDLSGEISELSDVIDILKDLAKELY